MNICIFDRILKYLSCSYNGYLPDICYQKLHRLEHVFITDVCRTVPFAVVCFLSLNFLTYISKERHLDGVDSNK